MLLNAVLLVGFVLAKWQTDPLVFIVAVMVMAVILIVEIWFLREATMGESHHT